VAAGKQLFIVWLPPEIWYVISVFCLLFWLYLFFSCCFIEICSDFYVVFCLVCLFVVLSTFDGQITVHRVASTPDMVRYFCFLSAFLALSGSFPVLERYAVTFMLFCVLFVPCLAIDKQTELCCVFYFLFC